MREARLARPEVRPAADDRGRRGAVVRRAERRAGDERLLVVHETGDRMDPRHLERGGGVERRQDPGQPAREHRLPRAGRPAEEDVVAARGRQLEGAPGAFLSADVGEVGRRRGAAARSERAEPRAPARARRAGTRPPPRGDGSGSRRRRREPPRGPNRPDRGDARRRAVARPRRPRGRRRPGAAGRRARARRRPPCRSSALRGSCCDAASSASAIGRSKPEPSLRSSAGARLTVIRPGGKLSSAAEIPLRTRSRASWQARSARPTIAKPGMPSRTCASTSTRRGSRPTSACVTARASTHRGYERSGNSWLPGSSQDRRSRDCLLARARNRLSPANGRWRAS